LTAVIIEIVVKGVPPTNSAKLLNMRHDPITMFYIKIELAAFIEGLKKVVEKLMEPRLMVSWSVGIYIWRQD
jgi:hypothetical protein